MEDKSLKDIIKLIETKMGRYNIPIVRETCLEKDLGMSGDDAMEFIISFGKKFNVDVSKFMAADYFAGEGIDIFGSILGAITGKKQNKRIKKELTVHHLEKAIIAGRLDEEIINS